MSKQRSVIIPEEIHLLNVNVFMGRLESSDEFLESPFKAQGLDFGIAHEMAHNLDEGLTRLRLFFKLNAIGERGEELGLKAEYGIEFHFRVNDFQRFLIKEADGVTRIDAGLGSTLVGIAYSTARGIILERLHGTFFGGIILPVIDPVKLLMNGDIKEKL